MVLPNGFLRVSGLLDIALHHDTLRPKVSCGRPTVQEKRTHAQEENKILWTLLPKAGIRSSRWQPRRTRFEALLFLILLFFLECVRFYIPRHLEYHLHTQNASHATFVPAPH